MVASATACGNGPASTQTFSLISVTRWCSTCGKFARGRGNNRTNYHNSALLALAAAAFFDNFMSDVLQDSVNAVEIPINVVFLRCVRSIRRKLIAMSRALKEQVL